MKYEMFYLAFNSINSEECNYYGKDIKKDINEKFWLKIYKDGIIRNSGNFDSSALDDTKIVFKKEEQIRKIINLIFKSNINLSNFISSKLSLEELKNNLI